MREPDDGQGAFLEATLPHLDAVHNVARHVYADPGHAEDLVQETYLRAYRGFSGFRGESARSWLVAICLNTARSEMRKRKARPVETLEADPGIALSTGEDTCEKALGTIHYEEIATAMGMLSPTTRNCIVLMDVSGLTAQEVAEVLGCSRNTVLSRVFRGRRRLATILEGAGVTGEMVSEGADDERV